MTDTLKGTYSHTFCHWEDPSKPAAIVGILSTGEKVKGPVIAGEPPIVGNEYIFYGAWKDHPDYGRQFHFSHYMVQVPTTRKGTVLYLQRYCDGIGPGIANRLFDAFGKEAVSMLRTSPLDVANHPKVRRWLSEEDALNASATLNKLLEFEEQRQTLGVLFDGFSFPADTVERCLEKWKDNAANVVARDPFRMMVARIPGCTFTRCDNVYQYLQLPLYRIKRQMLAMWFVCRTQRSGDTWFPIEKAKQFVLEKVTADEEMLQIDNAILMGVKKHWLATYTDANGAEWITCYDYAQAESSLARDAVRRGSWEIGDDAQMLELAIEAQRQKLLGQGK